MNDRETSDARPTAQGLAGRLRALRLGTDPLISQAAAAAEIGTSQNRMSRIEAAAMVPTVEEVDALARLYRAPAAERRTLTTWTKALTTEHVPSRVILRRGGGTAAFQARIRRLEERAELVRAFQPGLVLGVAQTPDYARVVFKGDEAAVQERMLRHAQLLRDTNRRWVLVQPIGALLWNMGGRDVMAEQMDALVEVSRRPNVDLRVVTADQPSDFAVTHGFHLYSGRKGTECVVGIYTGTTIDKDRETVRGYGDLHARLAALAVGGNAARAAITQVADGYRHR